MKKSMSENKNKEFYKGFDLISETQIPDCSSKGIYLRHRKTGLEVFHLLNDDEENFFAFSFRTPMKNSMGAPHIMEHSVFCGSEKFPLKEPFTNLMNQSVNTFLNAFTYMDKTVYPASSMVKTDYFNLLDVYSDAVFFPLLKKEAFLQEGYRIEFDKNGKPSAQGVVFNEMKGSYSSFESISADEQLKSLFPDTNYEFDSGGDPLFISDFSYEDFKAFHKKYYKPSNCLVFLYGNIPTTEQLDFFEEKFLNRLEKKYSFNEITSYHPIVDKEIEKMETPKECVFPLKVVKNTPFSGSTGSNVTLNWRCSLSSDIESYIEANFMTEVLAGNDSSPLSKALMESELGDDLAPWSGAINETRNFIISFGLHGVKRRNEKKVRTLILETLKKICKDGISKEDLDCALMSIEFVNREVVRSSGPYALVLLERALAGWNYGRNPAETLLYRAEFEKIRKNVQTDPDYVVKLIKRFILENEKMSFVVVRPSKSYLKKRDKKEKQNLKNNLKKQDISKLKEEQELFYKYQNHKETAEETSCIPCIHPSELSTEVEKSETKITDVKSGEKEITVFSNVEKTNGVGYFSVCFPLDLLTAEEYLYLPFFSYCASNSGWNGKSWDVCAKETALYSGGIYTKLLSSASAESENAKKQAERLKDYNVTNREWFLFKLRYLEETSEDAFKVFAECIKNFEFTDLKRIKNLLSEFQSTLKSSVVPNGAKFALRRSQCMKTHSAKVDEIWHGITQIFFLNVLSKMPTEEISKKFLLIKEKLLKSGAIIHFVADEKTMEKSINNLSAFIKESNLTRLSKKVIQNESEFEKVLLLPDEKGKIPEVENFIVDSQVGFASSTLPSAKFTQGLDASELVLGHWLSGTLLWERIRIKGGAYGAYASNSHLSGLFNFMTFRDPDPEKSVNTFIESLKDVLKMEISKDECDKNITGTYSEEVQPHSPNAKGTSGFYRTIFCITDEDRKNKLERLLSVKPEDIKNAALNILKYENEMRIVTIENKISKNASVNIKLPL